jgi:hypothetical protein
VDAHRALEGQGRRLALELARASFPAAAAVLSVLGHRAALNLALATAVVYAIRPLKLPHAYDASVLLAAAVLAWGNALSLYERILYYDLIVHFLVLLWIAPVLYFLLLTSADDDVSASATQTMVVVFALGLAVGALWEIAEWTSDGLLGTAFVKGEADTMTDLIADACGAFLGGSRFRSVAQIGPALTLDAEARAP